MVIVCMIVLQMNKSFNNYHKYSHELDYRVDQLIMKTVAMITMFNSNDLKPGKICCCGYPSAIRREEDLGAR